MADLNSLLYDIRRIAEHREVLTGKKIKSIHKSLTKDLNNFLAEQYLEYADKDGRMYVSSLDKARKKAWFMNEIVKNVDGIQPELQKEILTLVDKTYSAAYKGMVDAVKKADTAKELDRVIKDLPVNKSTLKQAMDNNISKLTLPQVMQKNRADIIYQIQQELNIGLINGDRYEDMAKRISERVGVSESKAMNITRTETHRNIEAGYMDSAEEMADLLIDEGYIYAVTWRTRKDERVRPQYVRRKGKGWKRGINPNGANHVEMEGKTVKAGENFVTSDGAEGKKPGSMNAARHDCNCRCFLEYNIMTVEEFAKATEQTPEQVRKKYNLGGDIKPEKETLKAELKPKPKDVENVQVKLSDYPAEWQKGAEGKNTQKLLDYINNIDGADPNVMKLYASTGKLENIQSNGITFKISHGKNHAIQTSSYRATGDLAEVKYIVPKFKGSNIAGQVNTTLHEQMHLLDMFGRADPKKSGKWFSTQDQALVNAFKNTTDDIGDDIAALFKKHNAEYDVISKAVKAEYKEKIAKAELDIMQGKSIWEDYTAYKKYEKERKKLLREMGEEKDYRSRNSMNGVNNLQDIYDALSGGKYRANGTVLYGHGQQYYADFENRIVETVANYASLSVTRPDLIKLLRKDKPELCKALDDMIAELAKKAGG